MTDKKDRDFIGFRATKENADYIKKQKNQQEFLNYVFESIRNGDLVQKKTQETNHQLDLEIKSKRLEKIGKEITRLDIKNRIDLIHVLHVAPSLAVEVSSGRMSLDQVLSPTKEAIEKSDYEKANLSWSHYCKSVSRTVEFLKDIKECKWCGVEQ